MRELPWVGAHVAVECGEAAAEAALPHNFLYAMNGALLAQTANEAGVAALLYRGQNLLLLHPPPPPSAATHVLVAHVQAPVKWILAILAPAPPSVQL